ncbi:MAG: hypothetical protein JNL83_04055 [Myxococcales bacterium]|nr:hypothetical protein [Myxococcales bacterium]
MSRSRALGLSIGLSIVLSSVLAACGSDGGSAAVDAAPGSVDSAVPDGWTMLLEGDWTLPSGQPDTYYCVYATVPRDMYIKAFRPLIPVGTHHTVLTLFDGASPADGTHLCNVGTNGQSMIYGSGVGSPDFVFPQGVGLQLKKGQRLLLNLHLYNASDVTISGRSGTYIQEAQASEIQHTAEIVLAGPTFSLQVPTGVSTQSGSCNVSQITSQPIQVFSLSQHMHKTGTHVRSVITRGTQEIVLQDVDYNFEKQTFSLVDPHVTLQPTDKLTTYCTFDNPGAPKRFGDSSDDEMCFTDLFYYPAQGASFTCTGL